MAKEPFEPEDYSTSGEGFQVLPCPAKLPHDLQVGQRMAQWFGPPYNAWYVGKILEINKRRTKTDNVQVEFSDETYGQTTSLMVADGATYGADKLWVVLKPIPVDLSDSSSMSSPPDDSDDDSGNGDDA